MQWVIINNLISISMDPTDPALRALIIEIAGREFEAHRLSSHVMLMMGLFYGMFLITMKTISKTPI